MRPLVVLVALAILSLPIASARSFGDGLHPGAACDGVTIIVLTGHQCHGQTAEDGCHGIVILVAADNNCHGGDGTDLRDPGAGCKDATVVNVAGEGNCRGGDA